MLDSDRHGGEAVGLSGARVREIEVAEELRNRGVGVFLSTRHLVEDGGKARIGSEGLTDRVVERLNEQLLDVLSSAGLTPGFQGARGLQ